jgi:hypothetical protein
MSKKQLFVEGTDDQHTIIHTIKKLRPHWQDVAKNRLKDVEIQRPPESVGGADWAIDRFIFTLGDDGHYGLVVDADGKAGQSTQNRWHQICDKVEKRLKTRGLVLTPLLPKNMCETGFIGRIEDIKVGIWVMPNNKDKGAIEEFLETMIDKHNTLFEYAKNAVLTVQSDFKDEAIVKSIDSEKANLHTFLAWQDPPGHPYGQALASNFFKPEQSETAKSFALWFEELFA